MHTDPEGFVRAHTRLVSPPLVPELRVYGADEVTPLWQATEDALSRVGVEPPFWAFAWPGSQALARWILDNPGEFAGKRVLDVGAGGGLAAIAAARVGALAAIANDVDPLALVAARLNAIENGVTITTVLGDLSAGTAGLEVDADIIVVGDLCYEKDLAARLMGWLRVLARDRRVVLAEPGRAFAPRAGVRPIARYTVPTTLDLESRTEREAVLLEVVL
jgi:predicted nicotinamide N-methyase